MKASLSVANKAETDLAKAQEKIERYEEMERRVRSLLDAKPSITEPIVVQFHEGMLPIFQDILSALDSRVDGEY